jgi:hypothetical protein
LRSGELTREQNVGVKLRIDAGDPVVIEFYKLTGLDLLFRQGPCLVERRLECPGVVDQRGGLAATT